MSDGTKAVDGKFDYANSSRAAKQLSSSDINTVDYQAFDDYNATNGITNADKVWNALNSDWDRKDTAKEDGPESIDITLKYDSSNGNWTVDSASDGANKKNITVGQTANGGFDLTAGGIKFANVILDETSLKNGDTIVLTLNNPKANIAAPTNAGVSDVDKSDLTQGTATGYVKVDDADFTATIATGIKGTDANMTEDINKLLEQLDGATVSAKYVNDAATAAGDMSITLKDGTEIKGSTDGSFTLKDGTQFYATKTTAGEIKLSTTADGTAAVTDIITIAMDTKATKVDGDTTGTMTGKIAIDYNSYSTASKPSVVVKEPTGSNVSISDSYSQATANLTYAADVTLQVGARTKDSVNFTFKYDSTGIGDLEADLNCTAEGLGTASLSLATQEDANAAIDAIGNAINKVSMVRGTFGAIQNRLEHKIDNLNTTSENLTDAESRIRDTDMATEMMNFTKNQILAQASQSMLAQANQLPQGVLSLLQ
jgi:flagellin-like hook-associated protein FlgL